MRLKSRLFAPLAAALALTFSSVSLAAPHAPAPKSTSPAHKSSNEKPSRTTKKTSPKTKKTTKRSSTKKTTKKSSTKKATKKSSTKKTTKKSSTKKATTKASHAQDTAVRRMVAGGPTYDDAAAGADTPELRELYAAERELFPPASPYVGEPWPSELPFPVAAVAGRPRVHASGLPPAPPPSAPPATVADKDMSWLAHLEMPDLPVTWDPRVIHYLEFFKDDARGRRLFKIWYERSGRYRDVITKTLRKKGLPEDLTWMAMVESGFESVARSPVGAAGVWQFMPQTGKIYGLTRDRWADQRLNVEAATNAAADFLSDLYRRFGSWDLAMAAYNMGYGGMLSAVRRYNTNDYWALSRLEGSIPWETTLYVPKVLAAAIIVHNLDVFGFDDVVPEPPRTGEEVAVAPGTRLSTVAKACGTTTKELEELNPELRASRTPPSEQDWLVKVPVGKAGGCSSSLSRNKHAEPVFDRYVVRFGETLEQIARARRVSVSKIVELNAIATGEVVRGGTVLLLPPPGPEKAEPSQDAKGATPKASREPADKKDDKAVVVVPEDLFVYPDRRRVFYRVQVGDTVPNVCGAFHVTADELRRWNDVDPSARLVEGMTLQLFVPEGVDLTRAVVLRESDVRTVIAGTDAFLQSWDDEGRHRVVVKAKEGDTLRSIGRKYGISSGSMARINRRSSREHLDEGEEVVLWLPERTSKRVASASKADSKAAPEAAREPSPTPPLSAPPAPDALPALP